MLLNIPIGLLEPSVYILDYLISSGLSNLKWSGSLYFFALAYMSFIFPLFVVHLKFLFGKYLFYSPSFSTGSASLMRFAKPFRVRLGSPPHRELVFDLWHLHPQLFYLTSTSSSPRPSAAPLNWWGASGSELEWGCKQTMLHIYFFRVRIHFLCVYSNNRKSYKKKNYLKFAPKKQPLITFWRLSFHIVSPHFSFPLSAEDFAQMFSYWCLTFFVCQYFIAVISTA